MNSSKCLIQARTLGGVALALLSHVGCASRGSTEEGSLGEATSPLHEQFEIVTEREDEAIRRLTAVAVKQVQSKFADELASDPDNAVARRDAHPKAHGCVRASFEVEQTLPAIAKNVGAFVESNRYDAWVRFSNASGRRQHDSAPDARGIAIKLIGVVGEQLLGGSGTTQDFLLVSTPIFPSHKPIDFAEFLEVLDRDKAPTKYFFPSVNPLTWRLREAWMAKNALKTAPGNVLALQYWSDLPFLLGANTAVKFTAKPCHGAGIHLQVSANGEYLRENLIRDLSASEGCFDFSVQPFVNQATTPIEDPTVEWRSPFTKVATLRIPPQTFATEEQDQFCENLSFNPWHGLVQHQPLGGFNRARRAVYEGVSKERHEANKAQRFEPTSLSIR